MSKFIKGNFQENDLKLELPKKSTTLNPNAAEFVPSALKSAAGISKNEDFTSGLPGSSGKAVLDRSGSNISNSSDDEAYQYWRKQLPDDITPDFSAMGQDESNGHEQLSLTGLSIHDSSESRGLPLSTNQLVGLRQDMLPFVDSAGFSEKLGYSSPIDQSATAFVGPSVWETQFINGDQQLSFGMEGQQCNDDFSAGFMNDLAGNAVVDDSAFNPLEFLASQFPGFSSESLRGVYHASSCDLNTTIEILTQLELQVDSGLNQNQNSKATPVPSLTPADFPALPVADTQNGLQASHAYHSASLFKGPTDFASTVRKLASQDTGHWKYERNGPMDGSVGTSKSSPALASSFNGHNKMTYGDKFVSTNGARSDPVWLETGNAVANLYAESREEARDFARVRNTYLEQARQAYLIGNKALAKDLSAKGQFYNMQMKAAHGKARESIYRQRNPVSLEPHGYGRDEERLIDLHGLHVNEAIHILKHELSNLRNAARTLGQHLQVMVCVGTGHHTKGSRTPARLPVAVEQYLIDEGLRPSLLQPGLLRVVIY